MSCDNTNPHPSSTINQWLAVWDEDWHAVARYRVYRSRYSFVHRRNETEILATGLSYAEAIQRRDAEQQIIQAEPGYRPCLMGNWSTGIQLENTEEARAAMRRIREEREAHDMAVSTPQLKEAA